MPQPTEQEFNAALQRVIAKAPEGLSEDQFNALVDRELSAQPTWSDRLGLNEGTDSPVRGFLRGAGAGAVDLAQGAVANITKQLHDHDQYQVDAANLPIFAATKIPKPPAAIEPVAQPQNMSGTIGSLLPTVAEMALGASAAKSALPSADRAGRTFETIMGKAKDLPIDTEGPGKAAMRIMDLGERGATTPKIVRDLMRRVTDPAKQALTYGEGRDFASNASRLSANEYGRLTPAMSREVGNLREAITQALTKTAGQVGHADDYTAALQEYARAKQLSELSAKAVKAAPYVAGVGSAGYWISKLLGGNKP